MMRDILAVLFFLVAITSCDKVEHRLEGKWQLETVEADGAIQRVDTVWYNFQTSLFEYQLYDPASDQYFKNYGYKTLEDDASLELELTNYGKITARQFVDRYTDWNSTKEFFRIEEISKKTLILNRAGKRYNFRKF